MDVYDASLGDPPQPTKPQPTKSAAKWIILILGVLAVAATIVIVLATRGGTDDGDILDGAGGDGEMPLQDAVDACDTTGTMTTGDEGHTLILDTEGEESGSGDYSYFDAVCVLGYLGVPDSTFDHIGSTRALDGMQTASWDNFSARWTYHPDNGLDITITDGED